MIDGAIKKLSEKCAQMITDNKLKFKELRQFNRVDGISGKKEIFVKNLLFSKYLNTLRFTHFNHFLTLKFYTANLAVFRVRDKSRARKEFHIFLIVQSLKISE